MRNINVRLTLGIVADVVVALLLSALWCPLGVGYACSAVGYRRGLRAGRRQGMQAAAAAVLV